MIFHFADNYRECCPSTLFSLTAPRGLCVCLPGGSAPPLAVGFSLGPSLFFRCAAQNLWTERPSSSSAETPESLLTAELSYWTQRSATRMERAG